MKEEAQKAMNRKVLQLSLLFLAGLVCVSLLSALATANSVPATRADLDVRSIGPNDFKPPACASMTLTSLVLGSGTINGSNANDLILGSNVDDSIKGKAGGDCLLGGGGNDDLAGDGGLDVCIGGPGTDTFKPSCETQIQ